MRILHDFGVESWVVVVFPLHKGFLGGFLGGEATPLYVPWSRLSRFFGDKLIPPLMGILISWVYKPLRTWVDEFIPYYMEIMGV